MTQNTAFVQRFEMRHEVSPALLLDPVADTPGVITTVSGRGLKQMPNKFPKRWQRRGRLTSHKAGPR
jgi:hypothetical protein